MDPEVPVKAQVSRPSVKEREAGWLPIPAHVCKCPHWKDVHLRSGGGVQEPGPSLVCPRTEEDHKQSPPPCFSSLQDTEIINTAILTGRTVAIPVKVIAIEVNGLVLDVSALVECESDNEDIIKVGILEVGPLGKKP